MLLHTMDTTPTIMIFIITMITDQHTGTMTPTITMLIITTIIDLNTGTMMTITLMTMRGTSHMDLNTDMESLEILLTTLLVMATIHTLLHMILILFMENGTAIDMHLDSMDTMETTQSTPQSMTHMVLMPISALMLSTTTMFTLQPTITTATENTTI